jgi:hypothetical protein
LRVGEALPVRHRILAGHRPASTARMIGSSLDFDILERQLLTFAAFTGILDLDSYEHSKY